MNSKKIIILSLMVVGIGAGVWVFLKQSPIDQATAPAGKSTSPFSFRGAPGWRQGPSNETSMALFGSERADKTSACFTSMEYKTGTIDANAARKKHEKEIASSAMITLVKTTAMTLRTMSGNKPYSLHHYSVVKVGSETLMNGLALGYVPLKGGYVKVDSHCNTVTQLNSTLPALKAYALDKS